MPDGLAMAANQAGPAAGIAGPGCPGLFFGDRFGQLHQLR